MSDILVVDDDPKTREMLSVWLSGAGYTVHQASDAESGLAAVTSKTIAVATIDKDMPGHDGTWLVEQIRQARPAVAMLLATGDSRIPAGVSMSRGVQGYLLKPFTKQHVLDAVRD